jgi:hypothetical protein
MGPTAGKRAEVVEAIFPGGRVVRKRVFKGQRALLLLEDEAGNLDVTAWLDIEAAQRHLDGLPGWIIERWPVQLVARAEVVR